jgi:hypothetical protein
MIKKQNYYFNKFYIIFSCFKMINFLTSTYSKNTNKSHQEYKISHKGSFHLPLRVITNKYYLFNEIRNDIQNAFSTNINHNS